MFLLRVYNAIKPVTSFCQVFKVEICEANTTVTWQVDIICHKAGRNQPYAPPGEYNESSAPPVSVAILNAVKQELDKYETKLKKRFALTFGANLFLMIFNFVLLC